MLSYTRLVRNESEFRMAPRKFLLTAFLRENSWGVDTVNTVSFITSCTCNDLGGPDSRQRRSAFSSSPSLGLSARYAFLRFAINASTTDGSASVEVSPRFFKSFAAILRRMRRMTFPERVLGRPSAH